MKPRGHYTEALPLRRYFRAMMWLGRPDTGFVVLPYAGIDDVRERAAATALSESLRATGGMKKLKSLSDVIDFLVGRADDLSIFDFAEIIAKGGGAQQIRSQVVLSDRSSASAF